ncbi:uncharacterized protein [Cicer arietinum]|uniref:Cationic amino acid transporter 3, mitochondrial-like isoform X2 n=1 Tax=Cicer arietinum TaxID=3827 RepID=A0A1S3EIR4_CICAR|nr:cationic amino acid transporter 3, mitochondrial-like isoform X2 [Cicer arietinum]XP_012575270.1 cationic amino acid transporter 3, mitochondrial-like isoform X2 [Cicer arietinum]XP_012575271.1 cationic amino acid transporter 3, mitochondrial-like isoform X2 [Cicer arietinum]XP_027186228.1 cationic amino acid transporter 3, mitochondrial-like isoform X2 [Cicer arietinum]
MSKSMLGTRNLAFGMLGILLMSFSIYLNYIRFTVCGVRGTSLMSGFVFLTCTDQDDTRHKFGHYGGFTCPFGPLLLTTCILINSYLLINLGYGLGRHLASTKLSSNKTIKRIRVRGGNVKWREIRLDTDNFSWDSEAITRKTRLQDMVYNASNNELVRT